MAFKFELEWRIGKYPIVQEIGRGATSRVYLVVSGAPTNAATRPLAEALKDTQAHIPLNPQGGLLMAQNFLTVILLFSTLLRLANGRSRK